MISYLGREGAGEVVRRDVHESEDASFERPPFVYCRWVVVYKARRGEENTDRALKLTAENLFLNLADPTAEPDTVNTPLLQFLALMLERKKLIKPRGLTESGERRVYEHVKTHQLYEVPVGTLDDAFFLRIQEHLDVLVGAPKPKASAPAEPVPPVETTS